jgi:hypothetical protein
MGTENLSPARGFWLGLALYFGLHVILRVAVSDALELDEAEQVLFGQWLQWGYSSQPPLYTWLQRGLFHLLGQEVFALALLKNLLLFALFGLVYRATRQAVGDERRAVLAALSLLLIPPIAWESARDLTHTVLAAVFVAGNTGLVLALLERRSLPRYVGLGLSLGLGLLAKSNFAVHITALGLALASLPEGRRVLSDPRILVALILGGLIYAPFGLWLVEHAGALKAGMTKLSDTHGATRWTLTGKLLVDMLPYLAPIVLVWLFLFPGLRGGQFGALRAAERPVGIRLLSRYFPILFAIFLALIWFSGVGRMKVRWLYPFFVLSPVVLFGHLPAEWLSLRRFRVYAELGMAAGFAILVALLIRVPGASFTGQATDLNLPFAEFAKAIRADGFREGIVIGHNAHFAGNFRHRFGNCCPSFAPRLELPFPAGYGGDVLIVWEAEKTEEPPEKLAAFVRERLGWDLKSLRRRVLSLPYRHSAGRVARMAYVFVHPTENPEVVRGAHDRAAGWVEASWKPGTSATSSLGFR